MSIRVRDSLSTGMAEVGEDGRIGLYVCGPTVYDHIHIGNARAPLFWDVVVRYLRSRDYDVTFVQNITDIEDKIINKANEENVSWREIVSRYTDSFHERLTLLGIGLPDVEPRATEHIPEMISLIEELIEKDHAYAPEEAKGDVYYAVGSFAPYGALSHQRPEEMRETEKAETGYKKSPLDFTLWKASKPGEPSWESPWGLGRPGWHIECSAMSSTYLGGQIDIHGGGADLIFPHHENEIAQSEAFLGVEPFARYWVHNGLVRVGAEKMSKSLGNFVRMREILNRGLGPAFRLMILQSHYRVPLTYSEEGLLAAERGLSRLRAAADPAATTLAVGDDGPEAATDLAALSADVRRRFHQAMDDDFNAPEALAGLFDLARAINRARGEGEFAEAIEPARVTLVDLAGVLGLDLEADAVPTATDAAPFIDLLLRVREELRQCRGWALSDLIRDELGKLEVV